MPRRHRLTPLQQRFVEEYIIDLNGSAAAIRVGIAPGNARQQAHRWLTNDYIAEAIVKAKESRSRRTEITADAVLMRAAQLVFTDLDTFVSWTKDKLELRDSATIPRDRIGALQEISETREGLRVKLADRMPALTLLFKHLGLLPTIGTKDNPLHVDATIQEEDLDLSQLSDEELAQLRDSIGALLAAQEITRGHG